MHTAAFSPLFCTDLVNYVLERHCPPTVLVVCSSRDTFLEDLKACIEHSHPRQIAENSDEHGSLHPLLVPTLHLISTSRTIKLAFVPTLPHLRAYLATYETEELATSSSPTRAGSQIPLLVIWGLCNLHRSTAEQSAQGLSRTLATAVEAAHLAEQQLLLAEPRSLQTEIDGENGDPSLDTMANPWREEIPLLSGSVRFGGEERSWAGRTIEVGKVVARWCNFAELNLDPSFHDSRDLRPL